MKCQVPELRDQLKTLTMYFWKSNSYQKVFDLIVIIIFLISLKFYTWSLAFGFRAISYSYYLLIKIWALWKISGLSQHFIYLFFLKGWTKSTTFLKVQVGNSICKKVNFLFLIVFSVVYVKNTKYASIDLFKGKWWVDSINNVNQNLYF